MRKLTAIILCIMLVMFGMSACNGTDPDTTGETTKETKTPGETTDENGIRNAPMPTRDLEDTTVQYYSWLTLDQQYGEGNRTGLPALLNREFDIEFEGTFGTHDTYWDTLATLVAAGTSPDVVLLPNWNYYPLAITEDLIAPLDELIDFSDPLWDDTRDIIEQMQMFDKTYIAYQGVTITTWFFYNVQMFNDYGLKTPREYYLEGNWTWDTMQDLANSFVHRLPDGTVETYGVGFQTNDLIATTGIELVETDPEEGFKFNLRDPKVARMMNLMYELGEGGTGALSDGNVIPNFRQGKLPMLGTYPWVAHIDFNDMRLAGNLDWVPLPKMDEDSTHYNQVAPNPGWGIVSGASNKEAGALMIEFSKWMTLGAPVSSYIPAPENAARLKYSIDAPEPDPDTQLTEEQIEWTKTLIDYPTVSITWQSWLSTMVIPGYGYVLTGEMQWSTALEQEYPVYDALLKSYFR